MFVPTGSASPDYFGGDRLGNNLFANSIVALRAGTGVIVWHFQTVHHDLWDYDVAPPPLLFDLHRNAAKIPAIAVGSKTGNIFILNRETGAPIFGVEERPVPKSDVPGEIAAATQPFPLKPAPITSQMINATDAWGIDGADRNWCRAEIGTLRTGPIFTPPSLQGTSRSRATSAGKTGAVSLTTRTIICWFSLQIISLRKFASSRAPTTKASVVHGVVRSMATGSSRRSAERRTE